MNIKKSFIVTAIIISLLLILFLSFTVSFRKKIYNIKEKTRVCYTIRVILTSLDKDFWKLKNEFLESHIYDYSIHNEIVKKLNNLKSLIKQDFPEDIFKTELLYSFLNQYKFGTEKLRRKMLKLEFSNTALDASFLSYITLLNNIDKNSSPYILAITRLYNGYRANNGKDWVYALLKSLESSKGIADTQLVNIKNKFIKAIEYNYGLYSEVKNARYQIKYSTYRFNTTFSALENELVLSSYRTEKKLDLLRKKVFYIYFWTILISFLIFIVYLSWLLFKKILDPISRVERIVKEVSKGNLHIRFSPKEDNEIEDLGKVLNNMLDKIKEINQKLEKEKERANRSSRLKGEFIRRISHEFRTPLNSVMGFSEVLYSMSPGDEETRRKYIEIIIKESEKLRNLIDDIFLFTNLENEDNYVHMEAEFDLVKKIQEIIEIKKGQAEEKGLKLYIKNKVGEPNIVLGEGDIFQKIFIHLIDNGIKFTERGEIEIEISDKKEEKDFVIYTFLVGDTGKGMTEEEIKNAFNPFYQSEPLLTRRYSGIGLGLTIVKKLVEDMEGQIWIESSLGKGTTYHLTLKFKKSK